MSDETDKRKALVNQIVYMLEKLTYEEMRRVLWYAIGIWAK